MTKFATRCCALAALSLCAAVAAAGPANAVVSYELRDKVFSATSAFVPSFFNLTFAVSDAAVARGSLAVRGNGFSIPNPTDGYTGDVADLIGLSVNGTNGGAQRPYVSSAFDLRLSFAPN